MSKTAQSMRGRVLGLDIGGRRVGIAISDELRMVASPISVVVRDQHAVERIGKIASEHHVVLIVAGLPTNMSGKEGPQAQATRDFATEVSRHLGIPVGYWDERLSSALAERMMIESGSRREVRKSRIDAVAASLILQGFLDSNREH